MNVYIVTSENIKKCSDCRKDINKSDIFYMISLAQNKNNGITTKGLFKRRNWYVR